MSDLVNAGIIQPEDAENHPDRHVLSKAMGVGDEFQPDIPEEPIPLLAGDILLLCTDGLWGLLSDQKNCLKLCRVFPRSDACKELVRRVKERGAPDNITLQVLKMNMATERTSDW